MSVFKYKAVDHNQKTVGGLVEAPTESIAVDILKEKQLTIISLDEQKKSMGGGFNIVLDRVKPKDVVIFSRQFSVLISANVALVQSLQILANQTTNVKFKMILSEIAEEVDGGARLSDTLAKHPKAFSDFYVNVVRSGESSGKLDEVLNYLADELEKDYDMTKKIKGAMTYPAFVITGMAVVGVVMMVSVVPKLTESIIQSGMELPLATKILMAVSGFMGQYYILLGILLVALVVGFKFFVKVPAIKDFLDRALLHLPIFGTLFQRIYLVRFTRSMETLLIGGVNITKALSISSAIVSNSVYKNLILKTKKQIEDGNPIATAFENNRYVPSMVGQMISIGEKTGKLDTILASITRFYGREIDNIVANLMTLMEPIIMVIIGIAVGIMVAAIMMPMYQMSQAF